MPDVTVVLREPPEHEQFLIRLVGGPKPGDRVLDSRDWSWPLPEFLDMPVQDHFHPGRYVKVSQSAVTDEQIQRATHVIRGAQYEWQPTTDGGSTP